MVYIGRSKINYFRIRANVFDKFPSFNSHPLVFVRQLISVLAQLSSLNSPAPKVGTTASSKRPISGFSPNINDICSILGYHTAKKGNSIPTFRLINYQCPIHGCLTVD